MGRSKDDFQEAQKLQQVQRFAEAETLYRRVADADPKHIGAWLHLGMVCLAQDKLPAAGEAFQRVLTLAPDHVDALTQLGIVLAKQRRLPEAEQKFRRAIELRPSHAKAYNNLGVSLTQMGRADEGLACYQEAARLQPDYAEAHFNLGVAFGERNQNREAIASYERALDARPDYPDVLYNLGMALVHERNVAEAVIYLEQAVRLRPDNPDAHNNLSLALADLGRFADAVACSDAALRLRPLDAKSHMNRGNALSSLGRNDEALACYGLAIRLQPDYENAHWNRALAWLTQGDFERGWAEYEWRWKRGETKTRNFPEPRWDGSSLDGKTILLWSEQGLGDMLHFARYACLLKERGATVWLECPGKMTPIFKTCAGVDRVLPEGSPLPAGFDCQAPLMSLPHLCGTTLRDVPAPIPYFSPDPMLVERWHEAISARSKKAESFKIGVTWQGNPKHRFDRHRSFSVQWFHDLAMMEGVELFSLQKGPGSDDLKTARFPIIDVGNDLNDFTDTAAVMENLDLVITCDSAVAHLAGALGTRVWVALTIPADWRWLVDRGDTPWYPTMRLFRQDVLGRWAPVFERMRQELRDIVVRTSVSPQTNGHPAKRARLDAGQVVDTR